MTSDPVKIAKLARAHSEVWEAAVVLERQDLEHRHALLHWQHGDLEPLRVAIVSAELGNTTTGLGLLELLQQPRPAWLRLTLVSTHNFAQDSVQSQLQKAADGWLDASDLAAHQEATALAQNSTHMVLYLEPSFVSSTSSALVHLRPAPVQVAWGDAWPAFAASSQIAFHTCLDSQCAPRPLRKSFVERVSLLPMELGRWWLSSPPPPPPPPSLPSSESGSSTNSVAADGRQQRQALSLPDSYIRQEDPSAPPSPVFCSLAPWSNVDPQTAAVWLDLLDQAPLAHFVMPAAPAGSAESARLLQRIVKERKLSTRVHYWKGMMSKHDWSTRAQVCDIMLEPLALNSVETMHAVENGVPVLSMAGPSLGARQAASLLQELRLEGVVAQASFEFRCTIQEYVAREKLRMLYFFFFLLLPMFLQQTQSEYLQLALRWATQPKTFFSVRGKFLHAARDLQSLRNDPAQRSRLFWQVLKALWEQRK